MNLARPFVKWAGGKSQLLTEIRAKYPERIEKYCEPFVGGGAVLFDIIHTFHPKEVLINDINEELINTYIQIKTACENVITLLSKLQKIYRHSTPEEKKKTFFRKTRKI